MLISSVVAGAVLDSYEPTMTFLAGAGFTILSLIGLMRVQRRLVRPI